MKCLDLELRMNWKVETVCNGYLDSKVYPVLIFFVFLYFCGDFCIRIIGSVGVTY